MSESTRTDAVLVVTPQDVAAVREVAAAHGVEVRAVPGRGFEPVGTVCLAILGTAAAVGLVRRVLDERKGGQVIDLRPGARKPIYRDPDLMYGTVVVCTADGGVRIGALKPAGLFDRVLGVLPEILSVGDTAATVTQAVVEEFGTNVTIEPAEPPPGQESQ
ncbi:hypothetical protein AB0I37_27920 [Micromonospora purpureochromogenes]|uniref:hypothetical protein n=1 Tax=Micromonospora purpureochromogenes TaxID=47872 RepID=UPI0033FB36EB